MVDQAILETQEIQVTLEPLAQVAPEGLAARQARQVTSLRQARFLAALPTTGSLLIFPAKVADLVELEALALAALVVAAAPEGLELLVR
jgi:hypothetical protein